VIRRPTPAVPAFLVLAVAASGYEYGTGDHGIHAMFVDAVFHSERWSGDLLQAARAAHPTIYFHLHAALGAALGAPFAAAALHLMALALFAFGVRSLASVLWEGSRVPDLATLLLAAAHFALGGVATLDPIALPRGLALGILAVATWLLFAGRAVGAFLLCGLAASIHLPSALPASFALLLAHGVLSRRGPLRERFAPLGALVGVVPVLIPWWRAGGAAHVLDRMDDVWWRVVSARLAHHLEPSTWPHGDFVVQGSWLLVGALAFRAAPPRQAFRGALVAVVLGLSLWIVLVAFGLASGLHLALGWQLEPWETCRFLTLASVLAAAAWLGEARAADLPSELARVLLILLLLVDAVVPALPLLVVVALGERRSIVALPRAVGPVVILLALVVGALGLLAPWLPPESGLLGIGQGAAAPVRPGWFLTAGVGAGLAVGIASWAARGWARGEKEAGPESWLRPDAGIRVFLPLLALVLVAARDPAIDREPSRLLPAGPRGDEGAFLDVIEGLVPEGALLAVPPGQFEGLRARLARPVLVTWKDGGEALFSRTFAIAWAERLRTAAGEDVLLDPLPKRVDRGRRLATLRSRLDDAVHHRPATTLAREAQAQGARFLVLRSFDPTSRVPDATLRYRSSAFHLYELGPATR
jgi:hypothetical protein